MDRPSLYALSFVSSDSRGLVAAASKVLFDNGFNLADSSSVLLQGVFSMIFIVTTDKNYSETEVKKMFAGSALSPCVFKYGEAPRLPAGERYNISVYGADKPGIVHEITSVLSKNDINIIDLQTKTAGDASSSVYIMLLEIVAPENSDEKKWQEELYNKARSIGTDINVKKIECYEL